MAPKHRQVTSDASSSEDVVVLSKATITDKTPGYSHDEVYARYREQVPVNSDFTAARNEHLFALPSFVQNLLKKTLVDERDYIALELLVNVLMTVVPAWIFVWSIPLVFPEEYQWLIHVFAPIYYLACLLPVFSVYQRFILTLHVTSHRRLFPKKFDFVNKLNEIFVNPFFGIPPGSYYLHHVVMHHRENNVFPRDMSSTMPYQRDSFSGLFSYILRYWTHQSLYLGYYAIKTGRFGLCVYYCVSWAIYLTGIYALWNANPVGTAWMVFFNSALTSILLMQGNFAQHMFIDPKRRFDNFGLAFNFVNHWGNQRTFNDGYHIIHHMNSLLHWSKIPQWFEDHIELFAIRESIVFNGVDTMEIYAMVMTGNWKALHAVWVDLSPGPKRGVEEFRKMIQARFVPLDGEPEKK